ncbi:MAG: hypothetical protein ABEJ24_05790 [Candidatus Magasanikbacteria bacterium]
MPEEPEENKDEKKPPSEIMEEGWQIKEKLKEFRKEWGKIRKEAEKIKERQKEEENE